MKNIHQEPSKLTNALLVEASAGTGKTYRLVSEVIKWICRDTPVQQILVITYTKNAAQELKNRIYERLLHKRQEFLSQSTHTKITTDENLRQSSLIQKAIDDFHYLHISTVHSFALTILNEYPLLCGQHLFENQRINPAVQYEQLANEYYYKNFTHCSQFFYRASQTLEINAAHFSQLLRFSAQHQGIVYFTSGQQIDENSQTTLQEEWSKAKKKINNKHIEEFLDYLKKNKVKKLKKFKELLNNLLSSSEFPILSTSDYQTVLEILDNSYEQNKQQLLHKNIKNVLKVQQRGQKQIIDHFLYLDNCFLHQAKQQLDKKFFENHEFSYDYLLEKLAKMIMQSSLLRQHLQNRFRIVLVDEFQDTDHLQWKIFSELFLVAKPSKSLILSYLFLVGDPKQSIYGFRGADLNVYLEARQILQKKGYALESLSDNYRSSSNILQGLNYLYQNCINPFINKQIHYQPLAAKGQVASLHPAFQFIYLDSTCEDNEKSNRVDNLRYECAQVCSSQVIDIVQKLNIDFANIAVLTYKNDQMEFIQNALQSSGIPCHSVRGQSIFTSEVARGLYDLCSVFEENFSVSSLKNLYASVFYSSGNILLQTEVDSFRQQLLKYRSTEQSTTGLHYWGAWLEHILVKEKIRENLLNNIHQGQQYIIDLEQLFEVLLHCCSNCHYSVIYDFLANMIVNSKNNRYLAQENTESLSEDLGIDIIRKNNLSKEGVNILTVHRAKGLEFECVILPFLWDQAKKSIKQEKWIKGTVDQGKNKALVPKYYFDYQSQEDDQLKSIQEQYHQENKQEQSRLLYVKLTRAKRHYRIIYPSQSRLQKVRGMITKNSFFDLLSANEQEDQSCNIQSQFEKLQKWNPKIFALKKISSPIKSVFWEQSSKQQKKLQVAKPPKNIHVGKQRFSYSQLLHDTSYQTPSYQTEDVLSQDVTIAIDNNMKNEYKRNQEVVNFDDILFMPIGTRTGNLLHGILQNYFATTQRKRFIKRLPQILEQAYFDQRWQNAIENLLITIENKTLSSGNIKLPSSPESCLVETPFFLQTQLDHIIHGYIDLIFQWQGKYYWLDWKSNFLGLSKNDYHTNKITENIKKQLYHIQYMLYMSAFDAWLASRIHNYSIEQHFGGFFYIYLRGLNNENNHGIWYCRPDLQKIRNLRDHKPHLSDLNFLLTSISTRTWKLRKD